ncbi:uncharacterized protein G2W53_020969 [Senna tora]|uniref:Uncharacterized protein n=1 Tax=Senna tora TaxID=362788 RepID=A0A834TJ93_9FABA|nr:uncharacterized protein G2W53_020969 [Senna tora]
MRFFLEFVSCWGPTTQRPTPHHTTTSAQEEIRSLVPPSNSRTRHRKKRGRLGASAAPPEWRPSLGSISETNIVPQRGDGRNGKVGPEREVKRKSDAAAKASYGSNDYTTIFSDAIYVLIHH